MVFLSNCIPCNIKTSSFIYEVRKVGCASDLTSGKHVRPPRILGQTNTIIMHFVQRHRSCALWGSVQSVYVAPIRHAARHPGIFHALIVLLSGLYPAGIPVRVVCRNGGAGPHSRVSLVILIPPCFFVLVLFFRTPHQIRKTRNTSRINKLLTKNVQLTYLSKTES